MESGQVIAVVLKRVRNRVKQVDLGMGLMFLAAFVVLFLLLDVVFDHVFVLQRATRLVSLSILKVSVLLIVCAGILFPLLRRIRDLYCAKLIEDVYLDMKNSLTSYLQVKDSPETPPDALLVLKHETAKHLVHVRPAVVVSTRRFIYAGYLLIAAMIVSFSYSILSPKNVVPSLKRSLFPDQDIDPPTKTVIASVQPGKNTPRVLEHAAVELFVKTAGRAPDGVAVRWREPGGDWWRAGLQPAGEQRWRGGIENVGKGVEYFIAAGDTKSDMFRIKTVPRPIVQKIEVEVADDPSSPGPTRRSAGGDISAAMHSLATVKATTNHRLHSAALVTESGRKIEMAVGPDGRTPAAKISVDRDDKYRIEVVDEYSHKNENPPTYVITCWDGRTAEQEKATETAGVQEQPPEQKGAKAQPSRKGADGRKEGGKAGAAASGAPEGGKKADASELAALIEENQNRLAKIAAALEKRRAQESGASQQNKGTGGTEGQGKAQAQAGPGKGEGAKGEQKADGKQDGARKEGQEGAGTTQAKPGAQGNQQAKGDDTQDRADGKGKKGGDGSDGGASAAKSDGEKGGRPGESVAPEGGGRERDGEPGKAPSTGGGRGGEAGPAGKPGEDTLGQGRDIETAVTLLERAAGIVEAADVGDEFLTEVGMSQGEFQNFVAEFREAAKHHRPALAASADGTLVAARDATSIDMLPGKGATIEMSKDRAISGNEKPDDLRELFVGRRESVSPEYRDMVDEYFRVISAGQRVTPNPMFKE